ncbi:hypothetical protein C8R44DRAFT_821893 [Mycena epipterygia]|nr:hypothetical protein C8R44DRAFT_821893 [Mycena epipterygia]
MSVSPSSSNGCLLRLPDSQDPERAMTRLSIFPGTATSNVTRSVRGQPLYFCTDCTRFRVHTFPLSHQISNIVP